MKNIKQLVSSTYAHRGFFDNIKIPENSMGAFQKAIKHGYSIELDVHITKDNKIVVFHDSNLIRMCGINKNIEECTYDEIREVKLLNTRYGIPLLIDVLRIVNGKANLLIETKMRNYNGKLEKELSKILDKYDGFFAIQSFNYLSINWFKKHRSNYITGILASSFKNKKVNMIYKFISKKLIFDKILDPDFISFDIKSTPNKYINKLKQRKPVLGWTFRSINDFDTKCSFFDTYIAESEILSQK